MEKWGEGFLFTYKNQKKIFINCTTIHYLYYLCTDFLQWS